MDFEGISWPGNIYQKFEAMCLEVEEVMYQDTVKYLENQVQTVGSSVKKFYSEVMQDIRPSDFVDPDPVKVAAAELPLNPYSHTEVIKKPKVTMKRDLQIVKKKVEDPSDFVDPVKVAAAELPLNPYSHTEVINRKENNTISSSYSVNKRGAGLYSPHSINRKENNTISSPYKMSNETNLASEILSESTSFCQLTSENEAGLVSDKGCDAKEARSVDNSVCTSSARVDLPPSVNLSSDIKESNLENFPETSDTDTDLESKTDTIYGSVPEEAAVISSNNSSIDAASNDIGLEIIERLDESTFEDTCVLVEGNELEVVSQKKGKLKSYKKKLREAFPLRMKSTRKREYEKLAAQYSAHSSKCEGIEQHSQDKPDSEWELL